MDAPLVVAGRPPAHGLGVRRLSLVGDERLARLVGSGSERAFGAIYERYHQTLYRYCRSIVRQDADAQDVLQSTFASAFAALQRGQRDAPLRPWLFRIAHNEAVSLIRRRRGDVELNDSPEHWVGSAEDRADERARLALLVADLRELPDRQRSALVMRELSGLSHEEIAVVLETSVGAAKQAVFEARRALMEFVEGRSMVCEDVRRTISDGDGRALRGRRVRAHLRDCAGCARFAAAIPARRQDLQALVPVLAPAASAAMLARVTGVGSGHGAGGGAGAVAASAAGKTVGATLVAKLLVSAAVVVTAAAGVTGVSAVLNHPQHHHARVPGAASHTGTVTGSAVQPTVRHVRGVSGAAPGRAAAMTARRATPAGRALRTGSSSSAARSPGPAPTTAAPVSSGVGAGRSLPAQAHGTGAPIASGGSASPDHGTGRRASAGPAVTPAGHQPAASTGSHPSGSPTSSHRPASGPSSSPSSTPATPGGQSSSHVPTNAPASAPTPTAPGPPAPSLPHDPGSGPAGTPAPPGPSVTSARGPQPRP
ncbi:MAG: sigma-70 family RNA polymerase sigma factor [Solirubrobacteraceae bacterium]